MGRDVVGVSDYTLYQLKVLREESVAISKERMIKLAYAVRYRNEPSGKKFEKMVESL